jgi:hypothetical protein
MSHPATLILIAIALAGLGFLFGYDAGNEKTCASEQAALVQTLQAQLRQQQALIARAAQIDADLRAAIAQRQEQDKRTSQELRNELKKSAASRAGCLNPDGVVRHLSAARDRAALPAAGGNGRALPASAASAAAGG